VYNITIKSDGVKSNDSPEQAGKKQAEAFMRAIAKQEIAKETRPGGSLNRVTNYR